MEQLKQLPSALLVSSSSSSSSSSSLVNLECFREAVKTCKRPDAQYAEMKEAAGTIVELYEQQLLRFHPIEGFEAGRFRVQLERAYTECIKRYAEEACQDQLDGLLWRHCFHRPIDHYRQHIKSLKGEKTAKYAALELCQIVEQGFGSLLGLLHHLAVDSASTYLDDLFASLGFPPVSSMLTESAGHLPPKRRRPIIYRLLIFCGDLARYRTQYSRPFRRRDGGYGLAALFYQKARWLLPSHGHAFNMLAVTWSLDEDCEDTIILACLYAYTRSICCQVPFPVTRANLQVYLRRQNVIGGRWQDFLIPLQRILSSEPIDAANQIDLFCQSLPGLIFEGRSSNSRRYYQSAPLAAWIVLDGLASPSVAAFDLLVGFAKVALDYAADQLLLLLLLIADFCRRNRSMSGVEGLSERVCLLIQSQRTWPEPEELKLACDELDGYLQADEVLQLCRKESFNPKAIASCTLSRLQPNKPACRKDSLECEDFEDSESSNNVLSTKDSSHEKIPLTLQKPPDSVDGSIPMEDPVMKPSAVEEEEEEEDIVLFKGFNNYLK